MKPLTTVQLQSRLKKGGRLMIVDVAGDLWATDAYFAVRVPDPSVIRDLLAEFNLPAEPMVCDVGRTVTRRPEAASPDLEALVNKPGDYAPLTQATYGGKPIVLPNVSAHDTDAGIAFEHPTGVPAVVRQQYVDTVELLAGHGKDGNACWLGVGEEVHIIRWGIPGGETLGLLMPLRAGLSFGEALSDAA